MSNVEESEFQKLFDRFEGDIIFDCHGFWIKFNRSDARKKIEEVGADAVLLQILEYLDVNPPRKKGFDVDAAWAAVIDKLLKKAGVTETSLPEDYGNVDDWIAAARQYIET